MDNISEFLDTLTILKDETSDLSITNYIVGAILLLCAIILLIVSIHALYYSSNHTSCISLAIFSLIMCAFIVFIAISIILAAQIHIKLIISTENIDISTLYTYFIVSDASIDNTVTISPTKEYYNKVLELYNCNFAK